MASDANQRDENGNGNLPAETGDSTPPVGAEVDELLPSYRGRWRVEAQGTVHTFDLDRMLYSRRPGPDSLAGPFAYDFNEHPITHVTLWPRVGGQALVWYDDPVHPLAVEQYRLSSTIVRISRMPDA